MFKLICILKSVILVSTNPLQGTQSCPLVNYQHNYGQPDGPLIIPSKYCPYRQQLLVQNQITPSVQTIPYLYNDQIGRLCYKVQQKPPINSFADTNTRAYDQNGIEGTRYILNPASSVATPNVKRYIIVPPEYFKLNQSIPNETHPCKKRVSNGDIDIKNNRYFEKGNHKKNKKNEKKSKKNTNIENSENPTVNKHSNDVLKKKSKSKKNTQVNKRKRKTSKKHKSKCEGAESPCVAEENNMLRPEKQKTYDSKLKSFENHNFEEFEGYRGSKTARNKSEDGLKITKSSNKKIEYSRKTKSGQETAYGLQPNKEPNDNIHLKSNPEEVIKKTADVDVCFDINEDCANLDSRKTRNNCYEPKYNNCNNNYNNNNQRFQNHHHQKNLQRECPANIASYLKTIMSMPQLNTNFINPFGNFPYNFNYLYQTPQQSRRPSESNKKRKKGKKKQKCSNSNTNEDKHSNKDQGQEVITPNCEKVVEPLLSEITSKSTERNEDKTTIATEKKEFENEKTLLESPTEIKSPLKTKIDSEENLSAAPVLSQEDIPFLHDNDIIDEYYPDFTSDNIYLSKEDFDFNNFHDRYYYASDNKAEMSREKRKYQKFYEKKYRKFNDVNNKENEVSDNKDKKSIQKDKNNLQHTDKSLEVIFRVPPPLEFPDFKTEMVNKDRDNPRKENKYIKNKRMDEMSKKNVVKHQDNEVETVYAHSKVAKYGASPNGQKTTSMYDFTQASDDNIIFSRDGDTTVIIARSLGHSEDYCT